MSRAPRPRTGAARRLARASLCAAIAFSAAPLFAQPSSGPSFQVNTYTSGPQIKPSVALDSDGDFVVVWVSFGSFGSDQDAGVHGQRYTADGQPASGEFQVNTYTTLFQTDPDVAFAAGGGFVVVWLSDGSYGTDSDGFSVQARRYGASGVPLGNQVQVNTYTTGHARNPRVDADAAGNFVVVWSNYGSSGTDTDHYSVQARRFAANGTPLGPEFQVNTYTTNYQANPDVAVDDAGRFVVAWSSVGSSGSDQSSLSIQAQRFAADGTPQGAQFQVNSYTTGLQWKVSVACDAARNFVVAWESEGSFGGDTDLASIQARTFAANGTAQGGQFQVNTFTTGAQRSPSVVADADRDFTVFWESSASNNDPSGSSVHGRWFIGDGSPRGPQQQINFYTDGNQSRPRAASGPLGNTVVAWESPGSFGGSDTSQESIVARRYDGLFSDGVERGDTLRWSATVP